MNSLAARALAGLAVVAALSGFVPASAASAAVPGELAPGSCVTQYAASGPVAAIGPSVYVAADSSTDIRPCTSNLAQPFSSFVPLVSSFGVRIHPITGVRTMHYGSDYSGNGIRGTAIRSIAAGTVAARIESYATTGTGNSIVVAHEGGVRSQYMHMSAPTSLAVGEHVAVGQIIGYVGTTGGSTGPHLHLEVRVNNVHVDPAQYLASSPYLR